MGLLSKRLMIAMRTEVKMALRIQLLQCRKVGIVSFLPKILGINQDFFKGFCLWGKSLFKVAWRKGLGEEFEFSDFCLVRKSEF